MIDQMLADAKLRKAASVARPEDDPEDTLARVGWGVVAEPGDGVAGALIAQFGASEAMRLALGARGLDLPDKAIAEGRKRWMPRAQPRAALEALTSAADVGARLLLPEDAAWPDELEDLEGHAPILLWVRGDPAQLSSPGRASVVGARAATAYGDAVARELAGDLAATGTVIVSGGAYGIDGAAHRAALGVGGGTVAFLAGGVDRAYPAGHQQLFDHIRASGAVVSELPCGAAPTKWRFLARNRLIAALGHATVVVEAGWRSGSLNTAGHASALGRALGAVPGPVTSAASAGCHRLLREYAAVCVTNADEVRELIGVATDKRAEPANQKIDPDQIRLLDALSTRISHTPVELARSAGLSEDRTRALLGLLAWEGTVVHSESGWRRASV